jgi:hypothetical protein
MFRTLFLSLQIPLFAAALSVSANADDYLFNVTFADGSLTSFSYSSDGNKNTAQVIDGAVRIDLDRYKDAVPYRTELVPRQLPATAFDDGRLAHIGEQYWYGISIFVPSTWQADNSYEVVTQWHGVNQGAAISLRMGVSPGSKTKIADRWQLIIRDGSTEDGTSYDLGSITPSVGQWVDWVFRIRWSSSSDGRVTVWRNKGWVKDVDGPTMKPDTAGPFWKFGIYKSPWKRFPSLVPIQSHRTLFFDNVRIAQGAAIDSF